MQIPGQVGMVDILESTINNFDQNEALTLGKVEAHKTGQIKGVGKKFPAIYSTFDATLKAKPKDFEMKFYLFVFDAGAVQYLIQASSTKPVWDVREKQIMTMIRSVVARK